MAGYNNFFTPNNQAMMNQLMRYKDNIDNMLSSMNTQAPVQNIINTGTSTDFEARILNENEEVENILISKKTMFLDKKNKKLVIKEMDGTISEEYEIIVPIDEKDKKILHLENKIKEMEVKLNEFSKPFRTDGKCEESVCNADGELQSTTKTDDNSVSEPTI